MERQEIEMIEGMVIFVPVTGSDDEKSIESWILLVLRISHIRTTRSPSNGNFVG